MNKNQIIILGVVLLLVLAAGALYFKSSQVNSQPADQAILSQTPTDIPAATVNSSPDAISSAMPGQVKEFTVTGSNFSFSPASLTVSKGDTVKITFKNSAGMHDFVIDEFNARTKTIPGGQEETVTFTADKSGSFEYYCSVANHRAMGMKGILIVQ